MGRPKKIVNSGDVKASPEITQEVEEQLEIVESKPIESEGTDIEMVEVPNDQPLISKEPEDSAEVEIPEEPETPQVLPEIPNTPTVWVEGLGVGHCKLGKKYEISRVAAVQLIGRGACKLIV